MRATPATVGSRYFLLDRNALTQHFRFSRRAMSASIYALAPIIIAIACVSDGTWKMHDPGKGFVQHYGFWAIFITTPIILFLSSHLLYEFTETISKTAAYCAEMTFELRTKLEHLVDRHVNSLALRSPSAAILFMIVFGMLVWCIVNVQETIDPTRTYHHDVFDAYAHKAGFYSTKTYVFIVFAVAYAIATFVAVHVTVSLISVMKFLCRHDAIKVDFFHRDNCGGMSRFGNINLLILAIYANFFIVIYAMYFTHRFAYPVMIASFVVSIALTLGQSIVAVYYIHQAIAKKKRECLDIVTSRLNSLVPASMPPKAKFPSELLAFRNHILSVHTFPYAKGASAAVNVIRFAPAAMAVIGLIMK
jgi:hypothetical protein